MGGIALARIDEVAKVGNPETETLDAKSLKNF